jgi:hypothetical protein
MRGPTVFLAIPVTNAEAAVSAVPGVLDALNAGTGSTYIPLTVPAGERKMVVFGSARQGPADVVPMAEKPGIAAFGDWVILCSNAQALLRALDEVAAGVPCRGATALTAGPVRGAALACWVDTARAVDATRTLKAVYELWLLMQNPANPPLSRRQLAWVDAWLPRLARFGPLALWLNAGADPQVLTFHLDGKAGTRNCAPLRHP